MDKAIVTVPRPRRPTTDDDPPRRAAGRPHLGAISRCPRAHSFGAWLQKMGKRTKLQ